MPIQTANGRIAFAWYDGSKYQILTADANGGDVARIVDLPITVSNPTWSPDGTRIAFQAGINQLGVMNTDGTGFHLATPRRSVSHLGLSWSPNGRWIVFNRPGGSGLYMVHPDGTGLRHTVLPGRASSPGWSPEGTRLIFSMYTAVSGEVDLYTAKPDGSDWVRVTDTPVVDEGVPIGDRPIEHPKGLCVRTPRT
jgi:Tol biopolymer transport system component